MSDMSRRQFLKVGCVGAAAGAAALTVGCSTGSEEEETTLTGKETWNGNIVNTNAADRTGETYEGDLKDYFKNRDFVHQIGFYAPDWREFVENHHELFGSGPFFHTTNKFRKMIYRGKEVDCSNLAFEACYGGWGSHTIEVVQQVGDTPTMFTEFNDLGEMGMNHIHMFVEDIEQALEACEVLGIEVVTIGYSDLTGAIEKAKAYGMSEEDVIAQYGQTPGFVVIDMRPQFGAMVQLVQPSAAMIHDQVISAMIDWDGETDVIRELGE